MRDRVTNRVASLEAGRSRWRDPALLRPAALLALGGLIALDLMALAPLG
jgi:hypothetical protein